MSKTYSKDSTPNKLSDMAGEFAELCARTGLSPQDFLYVAQTIYATGIAACFPFIKEGQDERKFVNKMLAQLRRAIYRRGGSL